MPAKKYRKIPLVIEAIKYEGPDNKENVQEIVDFTNHGFQLHDPNNYDPETDGENNTALVWDYLHETWVGVKNGDYIIKGIKGENYPHDGPLFPSAYEEADSEESQ